MQEYKKDQYSNIVFDIDAVNGLTKCKLSAYNRVFEGKSQRRFDDEYDAEKGKKIAKYRALIKYNNYEIEKLYESFLYIAIGIEGLNHMFVEKANGDFEVSRDISIFLGMLEKPLSRGEKMRYNLMYDLLREHNYRISKRNYYKKELKKLIK